MADHKLFESFTPLSTGYTYGRYDDPVNAPKFARTSASISTISVTSAGHNNFLGWGVGDLIHFKLNGMYNSAETRRVVGVASIPDAISVHAAISLGSDGRAYSYQRFHNTTSADNDEGWFFCGDAEDKSVLIKVNTLNATSVDYVINGDIGGVAFQLDAGSITSATTLHVPIVENVRRIQVGIKFTGNGANSVTVVYRAKPKEARP